MLNLLMIFGCYFEWRRIYRATRHAPPPRWLVLTTIAALSMPVVSTFQGGQLNIATLYLMLLGFRLVFTSERVGSWIAGGIVLVAPAAIKMSPGLVGAVVAMQLLASRPGELPDAQRRGVVVLLSLAAGAVLWFLVVPALFVGWHYNTELLASFYDHVIFTRARMHAFEGSNQGIVAVVGQYARLMQTDIGVDVPQWIIGSVSTATSLAFGIPVLLAMRKLVAGGRIADHVMIFGLAAAASLFYSPVTWLRHYTVALPFLASAPLELIDSGRVRASQWLAVGMTALIALQSVLLNLDLRSVPVIGPGFGICVAAFAIAILREPQNRTAVEIGALSSPAA